MTESSPSGPPRGSAVLLRVGDAHIAVSATEASLASWLASTFADLAVDAAQVVEPDHDVELRLGASAVEFVVDGHIVYQGSNRSNVVDHFVSWCNRAAIESRVQSVNLHAAGLRPPDANWCVVVPGAPGAGKSSVSGAAVSAGWGYLSDEVVSIDDGGRALPYPKPLTIKRGGRPLLAVDFERHTIAESQTRWYLRPADLGGQLAPASRVGAVVFSTYVAGAPTVLEPMATADAVLELATNCQDELDDSGAALMRLAQVCSSAFCGRMTQSDLATALELLLAAGADVSPQPAPALLTAPTAAADRGGPRVAADTVAVAVADGVVVHHPPSRQLLALDPLAGAIWQLLDGSTAREALAAELAEAFDHPVDAVAEDLDGLLAELERHELLAG